MKYFILFGLLVMFLVAGCTTSNPQSPASTPSPQKNISDCRNVTQNVPVTKEECTNVSLTEQVCDIRKLNYESTALPKTDLCISDGSCTGKSLHECSSCNTAMSRCMLMIQNLESQYPGTWSVDANYTIKDYGFNKEPITHTIGANTSQVFDFNQIYNPGNPITSAICTLVVSVEPIIQECVEVTRAKTECKNVTKTVTTQQQVCD